VGGKLHTITENTVTGTPARTWTYAWSGDHLANIQRPDLTTWELTYGANGAPADALTQIRLIGTDSFTGRVMAAFDYDGAGRVWHSWRGDPLLAGPKAVDQQTFTYTGTPFPTQTVVSQLVSGAFTNTTTYNLGRDGVSSKGKILSMSGNCPTCGLPPNTSFEYTDSARPLLPTAMIDGRSIRTEYTYNANGRLWTRKEAKGAVEERTTTYIYDANFPGLVKEIDQPSTKTGQTRETVMSYNATTSVMEMRTISGYEADVPFSYQTQTTYNGAGQPFTIDPPGYGTQDVTTLTYNVPSTNGYLPDTRTDPVIGATTFGYDGLNRRMTVTDINSVQTITAFDNLNRVTTVTRKGTTVVPDLVTTYFYDCPAGAPAGACAPFRDLRCVQMPAGNGLAYVYDEAGRLIEVDRKADCNPASQIQERTLYTLDGTGNRTLEERKRLDAGTEVSNGKTEYIYTCHLDKMTQGKSSTTESVTEYCYDEDDNLKQVWDANHPRATNTATQTYSYDNLNRLTQVSQPWTTGTADTKYGYDIQDHLAQVTDAEANVTTYTTSDRDLQMQQVSPVSGTTTYAYNEHGQLTIQLDARGITTTRTPDALDRVTLIHYSDGTTPDVTYTYDAPCAFGKGRLCSITQSGTVTGYDYDRFGRVLQDGALAYQYDANGNRTQITYPGNVTATYGYDFADRQTSLSYNAGAGSQTVVTNAKYLSSGPLTELVLANGLTEQHLFDARYFPKTVSVTGPTTLTWGYTVDNVGNITQINDGTSPRTYSYVDDLYFLKQGDGPWGTRTWTYDRIGNRLTEARGTTTDAYNYTNHNPRLGSITLGAAGARSYAYDGAGNDIQEASPTSQLDLRYDGANRLTQLLEETNRSVSYMTYDGRNFLTQARQDINACSPVVTQSIYSSEGTLQGRSVKNLLTGTTSKDTKVFYFAGRPVGLLEIAPGPAVLSYLSVDHLGTPILETTSGGASLWGGGFEPFGKDWNGAQAAGEFLRFPGQWDDAAWEGGVGSGLYYNVNRWYESLTGNYSRPDPLRVASGRRPAPSKALGDERFGVYAYVDGNPMFFRDPLGLIKFIGCRRGDDDLITQAFNDYCSRIAKPDFTACMCDKPSIPGGLKRSCSDNSLTVRCFYEEEGSCQSTDKNVSCGWSLPLGSVIRICPGAWTPTCGPMGCTLMHEMTHQLGHPGEKWPKKVEKCLGCG
jgi:RHS repeat-associated protein